MQFIDWIKIRAAKFLNKVRQVWSRLITQLQRVMEKFAEKMLEILPNSVLMGSTVWIRRLTDKVQKLTKNYTQNKITQQWEETVVTENITEDDIPEEIKNKYGVEIGEFEISQELELQLDYCQTA
ncbi:MAG: hypothetical protein MR935_00965 [Agathobaculum sp.]|uniref:hypothetical protein n=1 Tax=Agathobaculum sp. TaxID=2048138 RepID=UPI0025BBF69D|nr:hypothetical protein [Agathobaculum sp.]MCI7124764.1 hypothetical protein [Agathobaculum sp.]MDY3711744.1 hypothetical protein [Agathobaculum sp.]